MNYVHHALIEVGPAGLGLAAAETFGMPPASLPTLGMGALIVATRFIATGLDHPKSFISNSISSRIIRIALAVLAIPLSAGLAALLSTHDISGIWMQFSGLVFGMNFLSWALIALAASLGLMLLSWVLYKSLHHRGPLHSIIFSFGVTAVTCWAFWYYWLPWTWGLAFGWGWLWHIPADGLTEQGVPFFGHSMMNAGTPLPAWSRGVGRVLVSLAAVAGIILSIYFKLSGIIK